MKLKKIVSAVLLATAPVAAFATNGMNLEGYGPVATAMGGASMAYDNGAAAMMNNPATLGLMSEGSGIGVALGFLGPDVSTTVPVSSGGSGTAAKSGGNAYYMPAIGYVTKTGQLTYGVGVYSQGGMGTEYSSTSDLALGTNQNVRSEVGVGRLIFPLAYNVNDKLTVGGSIDWVWATMDIKMAATAQQFMAMATNMSSGMYSTMGTLMSSYGANTFRLDFSDNNDFSGAAKGTGFAGKLGLTYKISPVLTIGATYHSKTDLGDMETSTSGAAFSAYNSGASLGPAVTGKITIHNFQWPETYGLGMSYQVNDAWMVAADYKRINWSSVMKDFKMTYTTSNLGTGATEYADFKINQNWSDQDVFEIGASYKYSDALTLRFGANIANNPVPNDQVNPLFPAIEKNHITAGFGYRLSKQSGIDFSVTHAQRVTVTGSGVTGAAGSGDMGNYGTTITHSQTNWQIQYGYRW